MRDVKLSNRMMIIVSKSPWLGYWGLKPIVSNLINKIQIMSPELLDSNPKLLGSRPQIMSSKLLDSGQYFVLDFFCSRSHDIIKMVIDLVIWRGHSPHRTWMCLQKAYETYGSASKIHIKILDLPTKSTYQFGCPPQLKILIPMQHNSENAMPCQKLILYLPCILPGDPSKPLNGQRTQCS